MTNDSTKSLQAPIGIDTNGMQIVLDIHEKAHGPHGLIAGSTGSGKSEFIITYILSLAVNYHPNDVSMILIDYKGGGLAGAFQKGNVKLPHIVGTITNIDKVGLQRSLVSIQSELRRRQIKFNQAREKTDEGTIDIYKYQKLFHDGVVKEPIPHLLIICDEFAELKQQQPDFMDELISVARIGRSLGVHLILATQKPAGVVNDQIRSNSKFGICLKVQDRQDSMDVIKRPDAAELKRAGQFYIQVGNNEYFALGQSAWAGASYEPSDIIKKNVDNSMKFVSNIGSVIKKIDDTKRAPVKKDGEQLTNIVKYIYELGKNENIHLKPLWLENIPEIIMLDKTKEKYKIEKKENEVIPVIGEYDDPYNQRQGPVELDFKKQGNIIVYGNAESGKETLISTMVYDIITTYTVREAQMYLLDFGSEALKIFKDAPHVGDVGLSTDAEKINRLFEMIQREMKRRTEVLSNYGGDIKLYVKDTGIPMPQIIVVINNYEGFVENYGEKYDDILLTLCREGIKYGIIFVLTASAYNSVRYRLSQNFRQKIALQLNNEDDFLNIIEGVKKKRPAHVFGRGLIKYSDVYEFQTARICEPERWNSFIKDEIKKLNSEYTERAVSIPVLPNQIKVEDVRELVTQLDKLPIGIYKASLGLATYDFKNNLVNIISAKNVDVVAEYITHLYEEFNLLEDVEVTVFDSEGIVQETRKNLKLDYQNYSLKIQNNLKKNKHNICIIIGIDKFLTNIGTSILPDLKKAEELKNYTFIVVDSVFKLKNHEYDDWYKAYITKDTGIWVGNGISDQYILRLNSSNRNLVNNCGDSFGYLIKQEEAMLIKLIGMKDDGDDNG
jgi:S-DNA-T family DNA segregation ATPase FtsK/SpoIIIE